MKAANCIAIFNSCIVKYHLKDNVDELLDSQFKEKSYEDLLYKKNWIDTVQWHLEDIIRDPNIKPDKGIEIKRRIDTSNQERTDLVEQIDDYYIEQFSTITPNSTATLNTESPGWVIDRLSILCLKIYHMKEQVERKDVDENHQLKCQKKLSTLLEQEQDLSNSFDELIDNYKKGIKKIKVYRQMKMYNDDSLNPILYKK
jgi:hypothetical protein|tara:strand:+ start:217 stop:816 length:600 start_codon:yes stop_codon:yes gene_type:complete